MYTFLGDKPSRKCNLDPFAVRHGCRMKEVWIDPVVQYEPSLHRNSATRSFSGEEMATINRRDRIQWPGSIVKSLQVGVVHMEHNLNATLSEKSREDRGVLRPIVHPDDIACVYRP